MTERKPKAGCSDYDALRRRRNNNSVELRKQKRNTALSKKRDNVCLVDELENNVNQKLEGPTLDDLPDLVRKVNSNDVETIRIGATQIRRLLSSPAFSEGERLPPLDEVINSGVVPRLVEIMKLGDDKLKVETAWTLTNLASGTSEQTQTVVEGGSVPVFISLLNHSNPSVAEQSMWALGNIAGDRSELRDLVTKEDILPPLLSLLSNSYDQYRQIQVSQMSQGNEQDTGDSNPNNKIRKQTLTMLRTCIWTFSNLCRGKPPVNLNILLCALPLLCRVLKVKDSATVADACWSCSFITDLKNGVDAVIHEEIIPELIALLKCENGDILIPALRTIGNVVAGTDLQTQLVIDYGILTLIEPLLDHRRPLIRKEACWVISNVTAGTSTQVRMVLESRLIPLLIKRMHDSEPRVCKEAAWAVANATHGEQDTQLHYLVGCDAIPALCNVLETHVEPKTICVILVALQKMLAAGSRLPSVDGMNRFTLQLEECGGFEIIQKLKTHSNMEVYKAALKVIEFLENAENTECEDNTFQPVTSEKGYHFSLSGDQFPY